MFERPYTLDTLLAIMARLRDPKQGCPWDLKQTWQSILPHTLEEAYEVVDAINQAQHSGDYGEVKLELGDLLFQAVFYAQLAKEQGEFEFADVLDGICEKLIRRHPHVFADAAFFDEAAVKANWEAEKDKERQSKGQQGASLLDDVPLAQPALSRAQKLQKRCATVGFDWPNANEVLLKLDEEIAELKQAVNEGEHEAIIDELGDVMFSCVNFARWQGVDAEQVMAKANAKFERRFRVLEALAKQQNLVLNRLNSEQLNALWLQAKEHEKI